MHENRCIYTLDLYIIHIEYLLKCSKQNNALLA